MIKVEGCSACGRIIFRVDVANLVLKVDPEALDGPGAVTALVDGRALYRVAYLGGKPYRLAGAPPAVLGELNRPADDRPMVVREHRCPAGTTQAALSRPQSVPGVAGHPKAPQSPPAGRTAPFSGPSRAPSGVRVAESPRSEPSGPRCDECGLIMQDGEYVAVQLGEIYAWAIHLANCGTSPGTKNG